MKKKITCFLFTCMVLTFAKAQYLSLNKLEAKKLIALVNTEKNVKQLYLKMERLANTALTEVPNPIDTIVSEGHLASDPKKIRTVKSLADLHKIYALAISYTITNKEIYKAKCIEYLMAWATVNKGMGNPINDTKLDPIFEAYDLLKDQIEPSSKASIETWMHQVADAEIASPRYKSVNSKTLFNNWNSHRIKVVGSIAYLLNNKAYKTFTDSSLKKQILKNLNADGSGMDLEERDALHYHVYTLEPLLVIATIIKRATGVDYFNFRSTSGSSIKNSVDFLLPFVTGQKTHQEYVNSTVAFDKQRAANKEPGFTIGANFQPIAAVEVISTAAYFSESYLKYVQDLLNTKSIYPNWPAILNAVRN
ncbi:MAG: alginate lyase family protein [Sediminibacterium sp.]|jgi:Alginate lyase